MLAHIGYRRVRIPFVPLLVCRGQSWTFSTVATAHLQEVRQSQAAVLSCVDLQILTQLRTMSSKRKSPPTKLHEGTAIEEIAAPLPPTIIGGGSDGGGLTDLDETSSNNLSDLEDQTSMNNFKTSYKLSESSSPSISGSEVDDAIEEERSPPNKKQRVCQDVAEPLGSEPEGRRRNSECSSPSSDLKTNILYHNNNSSLHNNNSSTHPLKRSMDDVLKRLTSKMNSSTIKEEKRPTPATTPNNS